MLITNLVVAVIRRPKRGRRVRVVLNGRSTRPSRQQPSLSTNHYPTSTSSSPSPSLAMTSSSSSSNHSRLSPRATPSRPSSLADRSTLRSNHQPRINTHLNSSNTSPRTRQFSRTASSPSLLPSPRRRCSRSRSRQAARGCRSQARCESGSTRTTSLHPWQSRRLTSSCTRLSLT